MPRPPRTTSSIAVALTAVCMLVASCSAQAPPGLGTAPIGRDSTPGPAPRPDVPVAAVCDHIPAGPTSAPPGAVAVDPGVPGDLSRKTEEQPPGTTFWLAPGRHLLGPDEFDQVNPKSGNTYIGGPNAILDGRDVNRYAFTGTADHVTVRNLTVRGFAAPAQEGVVNHDSGDDWLIEHNTIEDNRGGGMMAGAKQIIRGNCLRDNGQYGVNAYHPDDKIVDLVVEGNEIVGNNTDDWERKSAGCGCAGGVKFWSVKGADIRSNWIHGNHGPGVWADTNNNDFLIADNVIEDNDGEAIFYETSYNAMIRGNIVRRNALKKGREYAASKDRFPIPSIYISESGGEPRLPARVDKIDIYGNVLENNWSGITLWENSDRYCNSPANTSTGYCTPLISNAASCSQPAIATPPLYDDCRWRTQRVDIHDNSFALDPKVIGCHPGFTGRMALISNFGTYPDWSPYKGDVVQKSITSGQDNRWHDNKYIGYWTFTIIDASHELGADAWQNEQHQDLGTTFTADDRSEGC